MTEHDRARRAITRHFAGQSALASERAMREHCSECAACREYYERHLLLSELDPMALSARDRIARGLGLTGTRKVSGVSAFVALAAAALFWFAPHSASQTQFTARGAPLARSANLDVYLVQADGGARSVPTLVRANSELAFAYASPAGHPYLMVFGVDEHGHVCWYYPEWTDPGADPTSLAVSSLPGTFELPDAVSHPLDGKQLHVLALFSAAPLHVREVENGVAKAFAGRQSLAPALRATFSGSVTVERELQVVP